MKNVFHSISREGRDTLWLLAMVTLAMLPHIGRLPLWCSVSALLALAWRARIAWRDSRMPSRWVLLAALALSVGLTLLSHRALFGREAGVTLVVVLCALKTLELHARRDALVVTALSFFMVLTQFLFTQSLGIAALMILVVWGLLTSLVLAQRPLGRPPLREAITQAGRGLAFGLPLMLLLFLLFPRFGPLWSLPSDAQARTGLSDQMQLGHVAELALDDSIAMQVQFLGEAPPSHELYFRGPVLDLFDGQTWVSSGLRPYYLGQGRSVDTEPLNTRGKPVHYEVTLEAPRTTAIPLLEATLVAEAPEQQQGLRMHREGLDWLTRTPLRGRVQIRAQAWTDFKHGPLEADASLRPLVRLPAGHNPRTVAWAQALRERSLAQGRADARNLALAVFQHIRTEPYEYTLAPGEDEGPEAQQGPSPHQIDRFWLDRRSGFCEHYASAFVVVMRAMGVPSRIVTGYQGGEYNPISGLYAVRNSHAHAWAEYWVHGQGWVRADPTAMVAPERINASRSLRQPGMLANTLGEFTPNLWGKGRAFWDATNHRWNVWVLQYARGQQSQLLERLGWSVADWTDIVRALAVAVSSLTLLTLGVLWLRRERPHLSPWHSPMQRVHRALSRAGLPPPGLSHAPASALSWVSILTALPESRQNSDTQAIIRALRQLDAWRYGQPPASAPASRGAVRARHRAVTQTVELIEAHARRWLAWSARGSMGHTEG